MATRYATDLTDAQWELVKPHVHAARGRKPWVDRREPPRAAASRREPPRAAARSSTRSCTHCELAASGGYCPRTFRSGVRSTPAFGVGNAMARSSVCTRHCDPLSGCGRPGSRHRRLLYWTVNSTGQSERQDHRNRGPRGYEGFIRLAMSHLMLKRLRPEPED